MKNTMFKITFLPIDPFIGIGLENSRMLVDENDIRKCWGIRFGLLFFHCKFWKIGSKNS